MPVCSECRFCDPEPARRLGIGGREHYAGVCGSGKNAVIRYVGPDAGAYAVPYVGEPPLVRNWHAEMCLAAGIFQKGA